MTEAAVEFNHAMVCTRGLQRALAFYRDLLGFEPIETQPPSYARIRSPKGGQTIALHTVRDGQAIDPRTEGVRLCFEVRGLDGLSERLVARGSASPSRRRKWTGAGATPT